MTENSRVLAERNLLLRGELVGLAVMIEDDIASFARWNQDLAFTAHMGRPGEAHSLEMRRDAFKQNARIRPHSAEFAVIELETDRLVGFGGLFDITPALHGSLFVGIGAADCRGQGFGAEATRLICEYGFFFLNLYGIKIEVHAYNSGALRMYERVGFKPVGRVRGANLIDGERYDEVVMDLVRPEWRPQFVGDLRDRIFGATRGEQIAAARNNSDRVSVSRTR